MKMKFLMVTVLLPITITVAFAQPNTFPATGNVGVGTATPVEKLSVVTPTATWGITQSDGTIKVGMYAGSGGGYYGTVSNHPLFFRTNNGAAQVTLLTNGRMGIGTTAPLGRLDVRVEDSYFQQVRAGTGNGNDSTNTCFGRNGLFSNRPDLGGLSNVAVGHYALNANTSGRENVAVGKDVLRKNTTGELNTAVGIAVMATNTTGSSNIAVGARAMFANTSGRVNVSVGTSALSINTTGSFNTSVGGGSLFNNVTGSNNTAIGYSSLLYATGSNNTAIGFQAGPAFGSPAFTNTSAYGSNTRTTASNQVRLGDISVTSIGGFEDWTNISDGRVKKNIKENVPGLVFINRLKPVTYNLSLTDIDKITGTGPVADKDEKEELALEATARDEKERVVYTGFIAQDVEKAAKSLSYDFSGVDAAKNDNDLYGLRYAAFVVPLVRSVQELSKMNEEKDATIEELKQQANEFQQQSKALQQQINELRTLITGNKTGENISTQKITVASALLEQNVPNPFNNSTTIGYTLPANYAAVKIIITDAKGKPIKEMNISGSGKGNTRINTAALNSGTYQYSLYVNDSLIDSRQMILSR